jgi:hypothetical protein
MLRQAFILFATGVVLSACSGTRKVPLTVRPENLSFETVAEKFRSQQLQYRTAAFKAKVDIKQKKKQSFTANIRIMRDSIIWASLTGSLGVEGMRLLMTRDSIFILDKINKIYYLKPFHFIQEFVPFTLTIGFLQNLIIGIHPLDEAAQKNFTIKETYIINENSEHMVSHYYIEPQQFVPLFVQLQEKNSNRQLFLTYKDYRPVSDTLPDKNLFSFERIVDFKSGKKTKITIRFLRVSLNEDLTFPFSVGEKYDFRY